MKTLEEVKTLIEDNNNWVDILKDVIIQKFGENKLISNKGAYSNVNGDFYEFLRGAIVSNGNLFIYTQYYLRCNESDGFKFGIVETDIEKYENNWKERCYVTQTSLKEFTKNIFNEENFIEYDFNAELNENEREDLLPYYIWSSLLTHKYNDLKKILNDGKGCIFY